MKSPGALGVILQRQSQYLKSIAELQSSVITALIYPAFLFGAGVLVSTLFVTFLVPQLANLLKSSGKGLPLPAQIMMGMGDFFKAYWWAVLVFVAAALLIFQKMTTSPKYRAFVGPHSPRPAARRPDPHRPVLRPVPRNARQPRR